MGINGLQRIVACGLLGGMYRGSKICKMKCCRSLCGGVLPASPGPRAARGWPEARNGGSIPAAFLACLVVQSRPSANVCVV